MCAKCPNQEDQGTSQLDGFPVLREPFLVSKPVAIEAAGRWPMSDRRARVELDMGSPPNFSRRLRCQVN